MTAENKKLAMYLGGAVVVGTIVFLAYNSSKKPIVVPNQTSTLVNEEEKISKPMAPDEFLKQLDYYKSLPTPIVYSRK